MKKLLVICLSVFLVSALIKYAYTTSKSENIDYVVQHYFSTGLFNGYKMSSIDTINLSFSNTSVAVVKVAGLAEKSPHERVSYNVFLQKNSNGIWTVEKVYPKQVGTVSN